MRVILFGATGMVGQGVLLECLDDPGVEAILSIGRRPLGMEAGKLRELLLPDPGALDPHRADLRGFDACFFCLGVSSAGMKEAAYRRLTYDLTIQAAEVLLAENPELVFCYVSGQGTDSSAAGRIMWARVKGATENALLERSPRSVMFRPGVIRPMKGVRSRTLAYQLPYTLGAPLLPLIEKLFPGQITNTERMGHAMLQAARGRAHSRTLEPSDINRLAEEYRADRG